MELDYEKLVSIAYTYRPYDTLPAFWVGVQDYFEGLNRSEHFTSVDGQAYDRGLNTGMRYRRGDA